MMEKLQKEYYTTFMMAGAIASTSSYCRYCSDAEVAAIQNTGFLRGGRPGTTYFTTDNYSLSSEAQQSLALASPPDVKIEFTISNSPQINGPRIVQPNNGQPGGGIEYWSNNPVQVFIQMISRLIR